MGIAGRKLTIFVTSTKGASAIWRPCSFSGDVTILGSELTIFVTFISN